MTREGGNHGWRPVRGNDCGVALSPWPGVWWPVTKLACCTPCLTFTWCFHFKEFPSSAQGFIVFQNRTEMTNQTRSVTLSKESGGSLWDESPASVFLRTGQQTQRGAPEHMHFIFFVPFLSGVRRAGI